MHAQNNQYPTLKIVAIGLCSPIFRKATIVELVTIMVDNYTTASSTNVIVIIMVSIIITLWSANKINGFLQATSHPFGMQHKRVGQNEVKF